MLVHCAHNWGFWTLLTKIPSYMKTVLEFDIKEVSGDRNEFEFTCIDCSAQLQIKRQSQEEFSKN